MNINKMFWKKWWQNNVITIQDGKKINFSLDTYKQTKKELVMEKITDEMLISEDIINKSPIITIIGNNNLSVENYKGIIEYTDEKVIVQTKKNRILIKGEKIKINYFYDCEMRISGKIESISYL